MQPIRPGIYQYGDSMSLTMPIIHLRRKKELVRGNTAFNELQMSDIGILYVITPYRLRSDTGTNLSADINGEIAIV
ncbi:hypothetical protein PsorP6_000649 [Peronosclerospora sorghi]|uniref:Uncharacterized protein n=1 Tax=Peronosclerospora sorghi TaxID=230839 RepID=A0ACC0WVB2_9STRA|nr:hypothetical protein PsorP6_000649 [Peronosclerospora sorghi]